MDSEGSAIEFADRNVDVLAEEKQSIEPVEDSVSSPDLNQKEDIPPAASPINTVYIILAILCVVSGVSSTMQSGVNARFGISMASGYYSLFLAFLVGSAVVMAARLVEVYFVVDSRLGRRPSSFVEGLKCYFYIKPTARRAHFLWAQIPALIGIGTVLVGILIMPELGFGLVFVLQIIGGMLASCAIDHFAILGIARSRITLVACFGLIVACVGASLTVISQIQENPPTSAVWVTVILSVLTFISGVSFPFQGMINNSLCEEVFPSPMVSALMTYLIGLCYSFIIAAVASFIQPEHFYNISQNIGNTEVWMWFTGFLGLGLIGVAVYATPVVGAGLWYSLMLTGQLSSATIFDHYNTFQLAQYNASTLRIIGVIIAVLSVFLFKLAHPLTMKIFNGVDPVTGDIRDDITFNQERQKQKEQKELNEDPSSDCKVDGGVDSSAVVLEESNV